MRVRMFVVALVQAAPFSALNRILSAAAALSQRCDNIIINDHNNKYFPKNIYCAIETEQDISRARGGLIGFTCRSGSCIDNAWPPTSSTPTKKKQQRKQEATTTTID